MFGTTGDGVSAAVEARELLADLKPLIVAVLGPDAAARLEIMSADPALLVAAPQTFYAELLRGLTNPQCDLSDPVVAATVAAALPSMQRASARMAARGVADDQVIFTNPAAAAVVGFLADCRASLALAIVAPIVERVAVLDLRALFKPGQGLATLPPHFEAHVASNITRFAHIAEAYYLPLLQALLELTRQGTGSTAPIPYMIGTVMSECRSLWSKSRPALLATLVEEVRILRNAEAHHGVRIDPIGETVTLVNRKKDGTEEVLGPWRQADLSAFAQRFLEVCHSVHRVFLREAERIRASRRA